MVNEENRRLSWNIYKWIRKNDPDLSSQTNRDLYSIAEKIIVEYHMMLREDKITYTETQKAVEKLADVENKYQPSNFKLTSKTICKYLKIK